MHDFHVPDKEELDKELEAGGSFGSGMSSLSKCLKAAFILLVAFIACMAVWFFTYGGLIQVSPQEAVIVLRFGKIADVRDSGWSWAFPYPVNSVVRVPASAQSIRVFDFMPANRSLLLDAKQGPEAMGQNPDAPLEPGKDGYLITGDANLIHTEWEIGYRISNPRSYYETCLTPSDLAGDDGDWTDPKTGKKLGPRGPKTLLRELFVNTVIGVTAAWKAEDILRPKGVQTYNGAVEEAFKKRVAAMNLGVTVDGVYLRMKSPPPQTIAAFADVIVAEQESAKEKEIAKAYAIERLSSAEEEKAQDLADAAAYKRRIVADVAASEAVFAEILKQYKKSPDSVMVSLSSTALSDSLSQVKDKFVISKNGGAQELRLKLNPEPPAPPKKDEARRDSK